MRSEGNRQMAAGAGRTGARQFASRQARWLVSPVMLLTLAAVLRFINLGDRELSATKPRRGCCRATRSRAAGPCPLEAYPPLYPVALSGWIGLFGDGEACAADPLCAGRAADPCCRVAWAREAMGRIPACVALAGRVVRAAHRRRQRCPHVRDRDRVRDGELVADLAPGGLGPPERAIRRGTVLTATALAIAVAESCGRWHSDCRARLCRWPSPARARRQPSGRPRERSATDPDSARLGPLPAWPGGRPGSHGGRRSRSGLSRSEQPPSCRGCRRCSPWLTTGQPFWTGRPHLDAIVQTFDRAVSLTGQWDLMLPGQVIAVLLTIVGTLGLLDIYRRRSARAGSAPGRLRGARRRDELRFRRPRRCLAPRRLRWFGIALVFAVALVPWSGSTLSSGPSTTRATWVRSRRHCAC